MGAHASAYAYDAANNRTSRSRTGTTTWAAVSRLPAHQLLQPDEALVSPDGRYSLALRPSGRMELWAGEAPVGAEALAGTFRLTDDGQARFLAPLATETPTDTALAGAWVSLRDDGGLVLLDEAGDEIWRSADASGQAVAR